VLREVVEQLSPEQREIGQMGKVPEVWRRLRTGKRGWAKEKKGGTHIGTGRPSRGRETLSCLQSRAIFNITNLYMFDECTVLS
jgi:hypothetical protein